MWAPLILLLACAAVDSRVSFTKSEVLDDVDLKGTNTADLRCTAGCRVYSPTKNDNIVVMDAALKEWISLGALANMNGQFYYLPPGAYKLNNKGLDNPQFVFWAVENGALNFNTKVVYVGAGKTVTLDAKTDQLYTVMSSSGAVAFSGFAGDYSAALSTVYATGADSATASSRPVYTVRSTATALNTEFPVLSPIATIDFKSTIAGQSVVVSGDTGSVATGVDTSSVYVTPGYVGCDAVRGALYTRLPLVANVDSLIYLVNSNGLALNVDGQYSIAKAEDALLLSINDDGKKYSGNGVISEKRDYNSKVKVQVSWTKKDGSKDNFAVQIDVTAKAGGSGPGPVATTPKTDPGPVATTKKADPVAPGVSTSPRPAVEPTTSAVHPLTLHFSCIVILFVMSFR